MQLRQNKLFLFAIIYFQLIGCSVAFQTEEENIQQHIDKNERVREECHTLILQWLSVRVDKPTDEINRDVFALVGNGVQRDECFEKLSPLMKLAPRSLVVNLSKDSNKLQIAYQRDRVRVTVAFFFFFDEQSRLRETRIVLGIAS